MRKPKISGLSNEGLKTFYISNIRSVICYAALAWSSLLLYNQKKNRSKTLQRMATRIIQPNAEYTNRLSLLSVPLFTDFMFGVSANHFSHIWYSSEQFIYRSGTAHLILTHLIADYKYYIAKAKNSARTNTK